MIRHVAGLFLTAFLATNAFAQTAQDAIDSWQLALLVQSTSYSAADVASIHRGAAADEHHPGAWEEFVNDPESDPGNVYLCQTYWSEGDSDFNEGNTLHEAGLNYVTGTGDSFLSNGISATQLEEYGAAIVNFEAAATSYGYAISNFQDAGDRYVRAKGAYQDANSAAGQ